MSNEYGIQLLRRNNYGTEYLYAMVVRKEGNPCPYPLGCSSDGETTWNPEVPKHMHGLQLDGLGLYGFVSDFSDPAFIGYEAEYRDVYSVDLPRSERMTRTLKKIGAHKRKSLAYQDAGDCFLSFAQSLKLSFVVKEVQERDKPRYGLSNDQRDWRFMTIAEGRNEYRRLIEEMLQEARERKAA